MEQPNYYAILPADIRYSKEISMFQKLLYAEITALTQKDGYCWASNTYFAEIYEVSTKTITRAINDLAKKGFLKIEINKEIGNKRKIYVGEITKKSGKTVTISLENKKSIDKNVYRQKSPKAMDKNVYTPMDKNVQHNNINNNNINNNKYTKKDLFIESVPTIKERGDENFKKHTQILKKSKTLLEIFDEEINNEEFLTMLKAKYDLDSESLKNIAGEFLLYRTEKNQNGIKEKWQMEKTFDVKRRFYTRLNNEQKFSRNNNFNSKKGVGIVEI